MPTWCQYSTSIAPIQHHHSTRVDRLVPGQGHQCSPSIIPEQYQCRTRAESVRYQSSTTMAHNSTTLVEHQCSTSAVPGFVRIRARRVHLRAKFRTSLAPRPPSPPALPTSRGTKHTPESIPRRRPGHRLAAHTAVFGRPDDLVGWMRPWRRRRRAAVDPADGGELRRRIDGSLEDNDPRPLAGCGGRHRHGVGGRPVESWSAPMGSPCASRGGAGGRVATTGVAEERFWCGLAAAWRPCAYERRPAMGARRHERAAGRRARRLPGFSARPQRRPGGRRGLDFRGLPRAPSRGKMSTRSAAPCAPRAHAQLWLTHRWSHAVESALPGAFPLDDVDDLVVVVSVVQGGSRRRP